MKKTHLRGRGGKKKQNQFALSERIQGEKNDVNPRCPMTCEAEISKVVRSTVSAPANAPGTERALHAACGTLHRRR